MTVTRSRALEIAPELAAGGGDSSAIEIFDAAWRDTRLNAGRSEFNKLAEQAYDREIDRLKELTGDAPDNPMRYTEMSMRRGNRIGLTGSSTERFEQHRRRLAEQRPELAGEIGVNKHTLEDLYVQQRKSEKTLDELIDRSPMTVDTWLLGKLNPAALAGGAGASVFTTDALLLGQNLIGPGGRAAPGVRGIIWGGARAAAANAGVTAATQPLTQEWRRQAGMEYGWDNAKQQILGAAVLGFGLDAGVRGVSRGVQSVRGMEPVIAPDGTVSGWTRPGAAAVAPNAAAAASQAPDGAAAAPVLDAPVRDTQEPPRASAADPLAALDDAVSRLPPDHPIAKAAAGDDEALLQVARESGAIADDPAVRGAAHELERLRLFGPAPEMIDPLDHYVRLAEAIQRSADPEAPPPGVEIAARPAVDVASLSPELQAARQRLVDQDGSPLDMARIMRDAPELVDTSLHLSDHKTKQAALLARLSQDAFDLVVGGELKPNHAALIARHVDDAARHLDIAREISRAGLRSEAQVKMLIGEMTSRPGAAEVHAARTGSQAPVRELAAERAKVLEPALKAMLRDGRVSSLIEAEAARVEAALPESLRGNKKLRAEMGQRVADLVEALSRGDNVVSSAVQDAALSLERGVGQRTAARALADRVVGIVEREGIDGLAKLPTRDVETLKGRGFSDPVGQEAKAQMEEIANRVKLSIGGNGGAGGQRRARSDVRPGNEAPGAPGAAARAAGPGDGGGTAGGQPGAGRGPQGRRDAGPEGRPVGTVGNFPAIGDGFVGTVIATRDLNGDNRREYWLHKEGASLPSDKASAATVNRMLSQMGNWIATIDITERRPGVWEVGMVRVHPSMRRQHLATRLYDAIETEIGGRIEPSGTLMPNGFEFWQRRNPALVQNHRFVPNEGVWLSPKMLTTEIEMIERTLRSTNGRKLTVEEIIDFARERKAKIDLLETIPPEARTQAHLDNSFSLRGPVELTTAAAADWPAVRAEVEDVIGRLPEGVRAKIEDRLVFGSREADGAWDPVEALVQIAVGERAGVVARHEEVHVLRDLGAFTDAEWAVVSARASRLFGEYDVEARWRQMLDERYPGDPDRVNAALLEEAVAEMKAHWKGGTRFGNVIDTAFKRISEMLERIGNVLRGRGFQSVDDIFRRIDTGEMGRRVTAFSRVANTDPLPKYSLKALPHDTGFDHIGEWLGIDPHRIVIDADHIASKRRAHNAKPANRWRGNRLETPGEVVDFVREVLSSASYATRYKMATYDTWNIRVGLADGTFAMVSIDRALNQDGKHLIRTAHPLSPDEHYRALAGALGEHGTMGISLKGDPAGLERVFADVSEAQRAAPGRIPDSVLEVVGQSLERAREMKQQLRQKDIAEAWAGWVQAAVDNELARRTPLRDVAEAERIRDLGDVASACKS